MIKSVLSIAFAGAMKAEQICEQVFERYIAPTVSKIAKDDDHVKRAARVAYRFIPFFARFLVSKERFEEFVLARVRFFVEADSVSEEAAASVAHA